ncbi:alpha/beta fold hydrolase [Alkalilacustris brevis]|uniref:alpha/beta fold hydrolase n=1 Tax=Alkalilacustris brevis TaxID=2026338 RepID=UPI000E0D2CC4|nr:alpha/beta fold hydrolase [Alkalilacustris brevis]
MLNVIETGKTGSNPPLLIVHGLFGSARNWGAIAKRMSDRGEVWAVDMRNHGQSPWTQTHSYEEMAADLAEVIEARNPGGPVDVVGHSMGGKAAMVLALTWPDLVRRMVVADIAPVAYSHSHAGLIAAMRGLDLAGLDSRTEADRRLAGDIDTPGVRAFLLQSLDLRTDPPRWRLNLDVLEAEMPRILGWPEVQGQFDAPVLFLSGALSDYVRPEHRDTIKALFPAARFAKIPEAGHWLHAEAPRAFEKTLRVFLD